MKDVMRSDGNLSLDQLRAEVAIRPQENVHVGKPRVFFDREFYKVMFAKKTMFIKNPHKKKPIAFLSGTQIAEGNPRDEARERQRMAIEDVLQYRVSPLCNLNVAVNPL